MTSFGKRLLVLRNAKGWTQAELSSYAGVGQSTVSDVEKKEKDIRISGLVALAKTLKVSTDYLLFGIEPNRIIDVTPHPESPLAIEDKSTKEKEHDELVDIPYYEEFPGSCGSGRVVEALQGAYRIIQIRRSILNEYHVNQADVKAFPSDGKSMEPAIRDKAIVFVDMSKKKIKDGKIFAICHGGLFKFKYLYNEPLSGVRIVSENEEEFPEDKLTKKELIDQEFEIVGYAFWVEHGLP